MKILTPLPIKVTDTAVWHGGNEYRGPGAWKRADVATVKRKRQRNRIIATAAVEPLDLTSILQGSYRDECSSSVGIKRIYTHRHGKRLKHGKSGALASRLESLSLARAPSHDPGDGGGGDGGGGLSAPPIYVVDESLRKAASPCITSSPHDSNEKCPRQDSSGGLERPMEAVFSNGTVRRATPSRGGFVLKQQRQTSNENGGVHGRSPDKHTPYQDWSAASELRVPNATVKMAVDDKCNAEALEERSILRVLLQKQQFMAEAMRQRRLEACLGRGGKLGLSPDRQKPLTVPIGRRGRPRGHRRHNDCKDSAGEARFRSATQGAHPLLFMSEADLQSVELEQMRLEDAEATHLLRLDEARRRRKDYATYYHLALLYGPLSDQEFRVAAYPGSIYHNKTSDAARTAQNWWWNVWPTLLRRRKSAALAIQVNFRGFLQRRRWRAIIRLRTLWGFTRIVAHAFVCWRELVAKTCKVTVFARRFRSRCVARCLAAWAGHVDAERKLREAIVHDLLKRASQGIRLRVFEAWARYTDTSLAIERMRVRSFARPVLWAWHEQASSDRLRGQLGWACAKLTARLKRWQHRTGFLERRSACCTVQRGVRIYIARVRLKRKITESRTSRALEIIQDVEDERLRHLVEAEQVRRDRLQAIIKDNKSEAETKALAFLRTAPGKEAVKVTFEAMKNAERIAAAAAASGFQSAPSGDLEVSDGCVCPGPAPTETEARQDVTRRFVWREQAAIRHDFNAEWPPPLRCPRGDCGATFVDPTHAARHAVDVHSNDDPEISQLGLILSDRAGLAIFEEYLSAHVIGDGVVRADRQEKVHGCIPHDGNSVDNTTICDSLELWKAVAHWRIVSSSSELYQKLAGVAYDKLATSRCAKSPTPPDQKERSGISMGALERTLWGTASNTGSGGGRSAIHRQTVHGGVDQHELHEASWQALVTLHETVGKEFLASSAYIRHLAIASRTARDAVAVVVAEMAYTERAEWLAEARTLRAVEFRHKREEAIDIMADNALALVMKGAEGVTESLVDDQAALLAVVILAERGAFTKVISAVWNEGVDKVAKQHARERRNVSPSVADALSEVVCSVARSVVMDGLVDECLLELTAPGGDMWPDDRAAAGVAEGVAYKVRVVVMKELLEAALSELEESGEAERLLAEAEEGKEAWARREAKGNDSGIGLLVGEKGKEKWGGDGEGVPVGVQRREGGGNLEDANTAGKRIDTELPLEDNQGVNAPEEENYFWRHVTMNTSSTTEAQLPEDEETSRDDTKTAIKQVNGAMPTRGDDADDLSRSVDSSPQQEIRELRRRQQQTGSETAEGSLALIPSDSTIGQDNEDLDIATITAGGGSKSTSVLTEEEEEKENNDVALMHTTCGEPSADKHSGGSGVNITIMSSFVEERAAIMMQSALRRKAVYRDTKVLIARNFVKLFDPGSGHFYWFNQTAGESSWEKPAIIDVYFKKRAGIQAIHHFVEQVATSNDSFMVLSSP